MSRPVLLLFLLAAGCTAPPLAGLDAAHPASPEAAEAPAPPPTRTLGVGPQDLPSPEPGASHHVH